MFNWLRRKKNKSQQQKAQAPHCPYDGPERRSPTRVSNHVWHYINAHQPGGTRLQTLAAHHMNFTPLDVTFKSKGDLRTFYAERPDPEVDTTSLH